MNNSNDAVKNNPLYYEGIGKLLTKFAVPSIIAMIVTSLLLYITSLTSYL